MEGAWVSIPGQGTRSHMLQLQSLHASVKSLHGTTKRFHMLQRTLEILCAATKTQCSLTHKLMNKTSFFLKRVKIIGNSLAVQWLGLLQAWVQSLVGELDPIATCCHQKKGVKRINRWPTGEYRYCIVLQLLKGEAQRSLLGKEERRRVALCSLLREGAMGQEPRGKRWEEVWPGQPTL